MHQASPGCLPAARRGRDPPRWGQPRRTHQHSLYWPSRSTFTQQSSFVGDSWGRTGRAITIHQHRIAQAFSWLISGTRNGQTKGMEPRGTLPESEFEPCGDRKISRHDGNYTVTSTYKHRWRLYVKAAGSSTASLQARRAFSQHELTVCTLSYSQRETHKTHSVTQLRCKG